MIYISCPTCYKLLGSKVIEYEKSKKLICTNPTLTSEEIDIELQKLVINCGLTRYCCKMRVMTCVDLIDKISSK